LSVTLAGRTLDVSEMAQELRNYAHNHSATLRQYDRAGTEHQASRRDEVTADDLGRMVVFSARLSPDGAVDLLEHDPGPDAWNALPGDLDITADPARPLDEWLASREVQAADALFQHYRRGRGTGNRRAWASKRLHLKWPRFFPIVDSRIVMAYAERASALARENELGSRRRQAPIRAYWAAIRVDLVAEGTIEALTEAAREAAKDADSSDPALLLQHLSAVRLADILTWAG
jgi:hypothetical protein